MGTPYRELTPDQRRRRNRQNAASRQRYQVKAYDRVMIRFRQDGGSGVTADQVKAAADAAGQSLNEWILDAIRDKL